MRKIRWHQLLMTPFLTIFATSLFGQNITAQVGHSETDSPIINSDAAPKSKCHPELGTFSKWSKPGSSLIPKMTRIKEGALQLDFASGRSAFMGVRFSDIKPNHLLQVLLIRDPNLTKLSTVFIPSYIFLDKNFCEISAQNEFAFREKKWVNAFSQSLEIADVVIGKNEMPSYMLLFSDARKNGNEVNYRDASFNYKLPTTIRSEYGYLQLQSVKSN